MPERLTARLRGGNGLVMTIEGKEERDSVAIIHKKGRSA